MDRFYFDFSGSCAIVAETLDEAQNKFWETLQKPCVACCDGFEYSIDSMWWMGEEDEEDD